jgi:DNA-binding SARP family transcriptional activator/tetratricopeptide (TPR) repeat protein
MGRYESRFPGTFLLAIDWGKDRGRPVDEGRDHVHDHARAADVYGSVRLVVARRGCVRPRLRPEDRMTEDSRSAGEVRIRLLGGFDVAVDGVAIPASAWTRRPAASLVKLLALSSDRRLHREQVIDALWPDDFVDAATPKLHKAAHFARKALAIDDAVVVRGEHLSLCPDRDVQVDVDQFEVAARLAMADRTAAGAEVALSHYGGQLLPDDRYSEWAIARRDALHALHLDLLRLAARWEDVVEIDPADEEAHEALMRRHAANGDRHAALRQYERLERHLSRELGVRPARTIMALRDELLAMQQPVRVTPALVGRERELSVIGQAVSDCDAGASRILIVQGPAGIGKSTLIDHVVAAGRSANFRVGRGVAASVEGGWPYAAVTEALADLCRQHPTLLDGLVDAHRDEIERALLGGDASWTGESSHQRLFVAAAELVRLASATSGLVLAFDDLHDADDGSLRLLHYVARSVSDHRVLVVLGHRPPGAPGALSDTCGSLIERHLAIELTLEPLDNDVAASLVRSMGADLDDPTVARVVDLAAGVPFVLCELARRAADEPSWALSLNASLIAGLAPETRSSMQRVAVVGSVFDTDEFVALSALDEAGAYGALDQALAVGLLEPTAAGYRFRHALVREALVGDLPPHRRRLVHRDAALRLIAADASPARIGHHLMGAGSANEAVPYVLRAAETEAAIGAYRDALSLIDSIRPHAVGEQRTRALELRGDLLNAIGDPMAASAYREALDGAPTSKVTRLRARLARTSVMSGDLQTASAALDGLELNGVDDAEVLLARANLAYFSGQLDVAADIAAQAERLVLSGKHNWMVLDLVSLQGLLAHYQGEWFDRIRLEMRRTRTRPEVANTIFDGHLCAMEYMLYGPTPYAEVIQVAKELQHTAQRSGALRAAAFASALVGEAALLSGDLPLAESELRNAVDLHRDLGSIAGEAASLQRLAEVRIAQGRHAEARSLLEQALPLARSSIIANHLMQRIFGALVTASDDATHARLMVDRAEAILGWDETCPFCSVMMSVPAAIACARSGDIDHAKRHLAIAEMSSSLWRGTSWEAALVEATAVIARAEGDDERADAMMASAAEGFERAGQPLDAARCRSSRPLV